MMTGGNALVPKGGDTNVSGSLAEETAGQNFLGLKFGGRQTGGTTGRLEARPRTKRAMHRRKPRKSGIRTWADGARPVVWGWILAFILLAARAGFAADAGESWRALVASGQLVDVRKYDPTIVVEMRYATAQNCAGTAVYPPDFPCLTRPDTAVRLRLVQQMLQRWGYRLKIWDAYRPVEAQHILYQHWAGKGFVANPEEGPGSLHSWGLAVDATMVDLLGKEVSMPSGFDAFIPEADAIYKGKDTKTAFHLHLLQSAMGEAGFMGLRTEWWHFAVKDWASHAPLKVPGEARTEAARPTDAPNLITAPGEPTAAASGQPGATRPR